MDYHICYHTDKSTLEAIVITYLERGYSLAGGVTTSYNSTAKGYTYYQAVIDP